MIGIARLVCAVSTLALILLLHASAAAQQNAPRDTLRIGYSLTTLLGVTAQDAEAATNLLVELIAKKDGLDLDVDTRVFNSMRQIDADVRSGRLHIVSLLGREFLDLPANWPIEPLFVPMRNGSVYEEILLLVHKDRAAEGLAGLKGGRALISVSNHNDTPYLWMDTILFAEGLPRAQNYLGSIEEVPRPSQVVLSVFFGQTDVGVSLRSFYDTLVELNPQIAEQVVVLKASEPLLMNVICMNTHAQSPLMDGVRESLKKLPDTEEGKNLLGIFGVERHKPFRDEYLESLHRLVRSSEASRRRP